MSGSERIPGVSEYGSVDPAPPSKESNVESLKETLLGENNKMFERMRALFSLRNNRSNEAIDALCEVFLPLVLYYVTNLLMSLDRCRIIMPCLN